MTTVRRGSTSRTTGVDRARGASNDAGRVTRAPLGLRCEARPDRAVELVLTVEGEEALRYKDTHGLDGGTAGVVVASREQVPAEVAFDNFTVHKT